MRYWALTIWLFGLIANPVQAQAIKVSAQINDSDIYLGQTFPFQIAIVGGKPESVDVSSLDAYNPSNQQVSNRSFNGYVTATIAYQLTAFKWEPSSYHRSVSQLRASPTRPNPS